MASGIPMWKGWFRLRNKECHDGPKSRSRTWWILSLYSFFPVQIKLMCNICSYWGNVKYMKYQEYFPFSIVVTLQPPDKKKVLYVILIVGRLFPSFNFFLCLLSSSSLPFFRLFPFPVLLLDSLTFLFSISFIFLPSLSFFSIYSVCLHMNPGAQVNQESVPHLNSNIVWLHLIGQL